MLRFKNYLSEEVLPAAQVKDGSIDLEKPAVRGQINATLASVTAQAAVTPYIVLHKISKALAYFHIIMPKRAYLEGDKGVEVVELKQFGHKMGMTDQGEFVHDVPGRYFLFLSYRVSSSIGGYGFAGDQLQSLGGSFKVTAKVVDEAELQSLLSAAEISLAESCDAYEMQQKYKAMAPKEEPHTALGDCDCSQGDSPSTKSAISTSMRKTDKKLSASELDEETDAADETNMAKTQLKAVCDKSSNLVSKMKNAKNLPAWVQSKIAVAKDGITAVDDYMTHSDEKKMDEDKDPCWKGYEMIGMKKKGGRKVPNCVPVEEATDKDRDLSKLASAAMSKGQTVKKLPAGRAQNAVLPKRSMPKGANIEKGRWSGHGSFNEEQIDEVSKGAAIRAYGATQDPGDEDHYKTGERLRGHIERKFGKKTAGHAERHAHAAHFGRSPTMMKPDDKLPKKAPSTGMRATKSGKLNKQDTKSLGSQIKRRLGSHTKANLPEETLDEAGMPASVIKHKQKLASMSPDELKKKFAGKSEEHLKSMARRHGYGKDSDVYSKHVKEDTATTTAQKKLRVKLKTVVKKALGRDEPTKTILVTKKGDPHAAAGGGVRRIPKDKYDPSKYNLASE